MRDDIQTFFWLFFMRPANEEEKMHLSHELTSQEKQFFYQCRQHIHALNTQPRRGLRATIKGSSGRQQSQMWRDSYERSS